MGTRFRRATVAAVLITTGVAAGTAHAATPTLSWVQGATLASQDQVYGPTVAQTRAGDLAVEYVTQPSNADLFTISWQVLDESGWSAPVAAGTTTSSPRSEAAGFAANDTRVATAIVHPNSGNTSEALTIVEQSRDGTRLFAHNLGNIYTGAVVALAPNNVAVVMAVQTVSGKDVISAWKVSASGQVTPPVTVGAATSSFDVYTPAVASVGATTFLAVWSRGPHRGNTNILRTSTLTNSWSSPTTLAPADGHVLYFGLAASADHANLSYDELLGSGNSATIKSLSYIAGAWTADPVVVAKTAHLTGPNQNALSPTFQAENTTNRPYLHAPGAATWTAGPLVPTVPLYCGGNFLSSGYQGETLHWFLIADVGSSTSSVCELRDYSLSS